jgi:hypothetical protein
MVNPLSSQLHDGAVFFILLSFTLLGWGDEPEGLDVTIF